MGKAVNPQALTEAIEVALEEQLGSKSLRAFHDAGGFETSKPSNKGKQGGAKRTKTRESSGTAVPKFSGDHYDAGGPHAKAHLARLLDALMFFPPPADRVTWRKTISAVSDYFMGSAMGRDIVHAWSSGGTFRGLKLPGPANPADFEEAAFETEWRHAHGKGHFGVGTIFYFANEAGWDKTLPRWKLPRSPRIRKLSLAARQVQEAGLAQPRQHPNLERFAWMLQVVRHIDRPDLIKAAFTSAGFVNSETGIGFPGLDVMMKALGWGEKLIGEAGKPNRIDPRRLELALRDLALAGYLTRSSGRERGAHGGKGHSFAMSFPNGLTWEQAIGEYLAAHKREHAEDDPIPATRHQSASPNVLSDHGIKTHQAMCFETTPNAEAHQAMYSHLSTEGLEEREGEEKKEKENPSIEATPVKVGPATNRQRPPLQFGRRIFATPARAREDRSSQPPPTAEPPSLDGRNAPAPALASRPAADPPADEQPAFVDQPAFDFGDDDVPNADDDASGITDGGSSALEDWAAREADTAAALARGHAQLDESMIEPEPVDDGERFGSSSNQPPPPQAKPRTAWDEAVALLCEMVPGLRLDKAKAIYGQARAASRNDDIQAFGLVREAHNRWRSDAGLVDPVGWLQAAFRNAKAGIVGVSRDGRVKVGHDAVAEAIRQNEAEPREPTKRPWGA